eukprot:3644128-Ditylum_brightwellii.AAC.1
MDDLRLGRVMFGKSDTNIVVAPPPISSLLGPKKELTLVDYICKDWQEFYVSIHKAYQSVAVDTPKELVMLKEFWQKLDGAK